MSEMEMYNFGKKEVWPKPELKTPWDAMRAYDDLRRCVERHAEFTAINGRSDHYVKNLDLLIFSCRETIFQAMIIREALTGSKTREEFEAKQKAECEAADAAASDNDGRLM